MKRRKKIPSSLASARAGLPSTPAPPCPRNIPFLPLGLPPWTPNTFYSFYPNPASHLIRPSLPCHLPAATSPTEPTPGRRCRRPRRHPAPSPFLDATSHHRCRRRRDCLCLSQIIRNLTSSPAVGVWRRWGIHDGGALGNQWPLFSCCALGVKKWRQRQRRASRTTNSSMLGSLCRSAPPQPLLGYPSTPVPTPRAQVLRLARASSPPLFTRGNEQAVSDGSRARVATVNTLHGSVAEVRAQEETPLLVFFAGGSFTLFMLLLLFVSLFLSEFIMLRVTLTLDS
jgi:hypothetical protein